MLRWILYLPLSILTSVLCYLTNPIAVLFCDKNGELPGVFGLWQTWDNSCNPSDIVTIAPKFLQYGWSNHYREYKDATTYLRSVNRERWYTVCYNPHFTMLERLKRYICRVLWLTRNNAYGWGFYVLGHTAMPCFEIVKDTPEVQHIREINGVGWMYKSTAEIFSAFGWRVRWNNLFGWKLDASARYDTRSMIANRVAFSFERKG